MGCNRAAYFAKGAWNSLDWGAGDGERLSVDSTFEELGAGAQVPAWLLPGLHLLPEDLQAQGLIRPPLFHARNRILMQKTLT